MEMNGWPVPSVDARVWNMTIGNAGGVIWITWIIKQALPLISDFLISGLVLTNYNPSFLNERDQYRS